MIVKIIMVRKQPGESALAASLLVKLPGPTGHSSLMPRIRSLAAVSDILDSSNISVSGTVPKLKALTVR